MKNSSLHQTEDVSLQVKRRWCKKVYETAQATIRMVENNSALFRCDRRPAHVQRSDQGEDAKSWQKAIDTEVNAINENKTWTLVPRSEADNILTSKWGL